MGWTAAAIGLTAGSTVMGIMGERAQGKAAAAAGAYERAQYEREAKSRFARGTRDAYEARQQGRRAVSDARAAMAGSGGVTDDAGMTRMAGDIKSRSNYNALSALYDAQTEAQGLRAQGRAADYRGRTALRASRGRMIQTLLSGGSQIAMMKAG